MVHETLFDQPVGSISLDADVFPIDQEPEGPTSIDRPCSPIASRNESATCWKSPCDVGSGYRLYTVQAADRASTTEVARAGSAVISRY